MKTKINNQKMTLHGFDKKGDKLHPITRSQPFSDQSQPHYGMPITTCSFLMMLFRFWKSAKADPQKPEHNVLWVDFSKASLFRILAQESCEHVRFYFALPDEGVNKASLALEGLDSDKKPIGLDQILAVAKLMTNENSQDPETHRGIMPKDDGDDPQPSHEEKGNGGPPADGKRNPKSKGVQYKNVFSLTEFIEENKQRQDEWAEFDKFIKLYYEQAQKPVELPKPKKKGK